MTASARPQVGLLVLDLDDTVWTWFDAWHKSFSAMLTELTAVTGFSRSDLIPAIKLWHEIKGTAEYSWLLDELPLLDKHRDGKKAREAFDSVLHAQNSARKHNTHLYPGVSTTLRYVKSHGVKVVAYTESLAFWTEWRMRLTGLDGVIDVLYSSPDHDFPSGETAETVRTLPDEAYGMNQTIHKHVAPGISKPNPQILREIIAEHGIAGRDVVYVGDSLDRDVEMAQRVGVIDVHAKYGEMFNRPEYQLLRDVTHWKPSAVDKEQSTDPSVKAKPSYVLDEGFYQLLEFFDFHKPFDTEAHLHLWKEIVGVQMHFNDIGWRIRALALTVLTFTIGAVGFVYVNTDPTSIGDYEVSPAAAIPLVGAGLWAAFWFVDRGWFHKLLIGSVLEGASIETALRSHGVTVNLGGQISAQSPIKFFKYQRRADRLKGAPRVPRMFLGKPLEWHSSLRLNMFYWIGLTLLLASMILVLANGPHREAAGPPPSPPIVNNNITVEPPAPPAVPE